jgi:hypothetical protein
MKRIQSTASAGQFKRFSTAAADLKAGAGQGIARAGAVYSLVKKLGNWPM